MTETKTDKSTDEKTPEEIAAAEEANALLLATGDLSHSINSGEPVRMAQDAYVGIVGTARRFNEGTGDLAAVQAELDRVFGDGKIKAEDITTPPEPEAAPKDATATEQSKARR